MIPIIIPLKLDLMTKILKFVLTDQSDSQSNYFYI
jgi:hypothetical protein